MRMILPLLIISTAVADESLFQVQVSDKQTTEIRASGTLQMKTRFGSATVDVDKIDEIRIGDKTTTVIASDGTDLQGKLDWSSVSFKSDDATIEQASWKSVRAIRKAKAVPEEYTTGRDANRLTYYLRPPADYTPDKKWPTLVMLHGSNMNAKAYMETVIGSWPKLAETHLLIGINGERRSSSSSADNPRYNYSYVNFAGKSKYKGYPGTDRESPALVAELLTELRERLPISHFYLIGHSQGGFLTYSVTMNYPELIDGAIPVSAGAIIQAVPDAYKNEELIKQQKQTPIAVVHGKTDRSVRFQQGKATFEAFEKAEFPMLKFFTHETAGHRFMFLPIEEAVTWLDEQRTGKSTADN